jgi:hypothetical protein
MWTLEGWGIYKYIMTTTQKIRHDGTLYYSVYLVARLLGTNSAKVRKLMVTENLEWMNFRVNGPIYISADSFAEYEERVMNQE